MEVGAICVQSACYATCSQVMKLMKEFKTRDPVKRLEECDYELGYFRASQSKPARHRNWICLQQQVTSKAQPIVTVYEKLDERCGLFISEVQSSKLKPISHAWGYWSVYQKNKNHHHGRHARKGMGERRTYLNRKKSAAMGGKSPTLDEKSILWDRGITNWLRMPAKTAFRQALHACGEPLRNTKKSLPFSSKEMLFPSL